jgi:hypothetical protein
MTRFSTVSVELGCSVLGTNRSAYGAKRAYLRATTPSAHAPKPKPTYANGPEIG